jgi:hypothetical protein
MVKNGFDLAEDQPTKLKKVQVRLSSLNNRNKK